jgi:hypothetical protein
MSVARRLGLGTALLLLATAPFVALRPGRVPAQQAPRPGAPTSILSDRDYVPVLPGAAPDFDEILRRLKAAVAADSRDSLLPLVSLPLVWGSRCLPEEDITVARVFTPEMRRALQANPPLVASRAYAGTYIAVRLQYSDADEGAEELLEFERLDVGFRLIRVGTLSVDCNASAMADTAAVGAEAAPSMAPEPTPTTSAPRDGPRSSGGGRIMLSLLGVLIYWFVAYRIMRARMQKRPELRRRAIVGSTVALLVAGFVGVYLPTQVPTGMWDGFFRFWLYLAAVFIVIFATPPLAAALSLTGARE